MLVPEQFWKTVWDCFHFNAEHIQLITGPSSFFILSFLSAQILPQMMKITWNGNKSLINISVEYLKGLNLLRKSLGMKHPNKNLFNPSKITSTKPWQKHFLVETLKLRAGISEHQLITFLQIRHYLFPRNFLVPLDPFQSFLTYRVTNTEQVLYHSNWGNICWYWLIECHKEADRKTLWNEVFRFALQSFMHTLSVSKIVCTVGQGPGHAYK